MKPADAEDVLAPLVQQDDIDDQVQFAAWQECDGQLAGHLLGEPADSPGQPAEEVVEAVEGMPLLVGDASSADRLEDVKLGAMPQAGAPAEDDLTLDGEG